MNQLYNILNSTSLNGRELLEEEVDFIKEKFTDNGYPKELLDLLRKFPIIGMGFSLSEKDDVSGYGVEMEWMNPLEQYEESFMLYPGMIAFKKGYLPIGKCMEGSGNPYFLDLNNKNWIVRIIHDCIDEDNLSGDCIEKVIKIDGLFLANPM